MQFDSIEIGSYLKKLRKEKNLTLNEVADTIDMSVSLLSQIENDKASPSLNSLQLLLRFYGIGLSAFFNQVEKNDFLIVKKNDAEIYANKNNRVTLTFLASKLQNTNKVSYKAHMEPGSELLIARLDEEILGERFVYIISGSVDLILKNKDKYRLTSDDSIIVRSFVECKLKNDGSRPSKIIISGTPPLF